MLPLRFPNNGLRAKVFVRNIGFKLRVIRLYHVESFYAFLLCFGNEGSEEEGRPALMQGRPPSARPRPRTPARRWLATARASPQGAAAHRGSSPQGRRLQARQATASPAPITSRLQGARKGLRPAASLVASRVGGASHRVAASWQGGFQRARAATAYAG
ncbi:hypothetical protein GW17_00047095 [Ensete ventricosum]|nr:hypothetical protein GW17_00047095 [Ensete ventricosum]